MGNHKVAGPIAQGPSPPDVATTLVATTAGLVAVASGPTTADDDGEGSDGGQQVRK